MKYLLALVAIILVSGCVFTTPSSEVGGGLQIALSTDPPQIFSKGVARVNVDLQNDNPRQITEVEYDVFDPGLMSKAVQEGSVCSTKIDFMTPNQFKTFSCTLSAPQTIENTITNEINARVSYRTYLPAVQVIEMITEYEYQQQQYSGKLQPSPGPFIYRDKNIELEVGFSDPLPIVVRPNKDYYIYFTVRNIGNGFVSSFNAGDFSVTPVRKESPQVVDCSNAGFTSPSWKLEPVGKEFPRIACRLILPQGVTLVENYGLLIGINYKYEVRGTTAVSIVR